jgi:hypothetical protein
MSSFISGTLAEFLVQQHCFEAIASVYMASKSLLHTSHQFYCSLGFPPSLFRAGDLFTI